MKIKNLALILIVMLGCNIFTEARSGNPVLTIKSAVDPAISRAVQSFSDKNSKDAGRVKIFKLDVQGAWALAWARTIDKKLDDAQFLLHKEKGDWKVLVMGTALIGSGEEYKVPVRLRKKWNL